MSLVVEVQGVALRFVGLDGRTIEGSLFVPMVGDRAARPQTVVERLNDPSTRFVPVRVGDRVELLNLAWIAYVASTGRAPEIAAREEIGARRERVELELAGGSTVSGELIYTLPPGHSRVSDLLNAAAERFLLLETGAETIYVHGTAVVRARTD